MVAKAFLLALVSLQLVSGLVVPRQGSGTQFITGPCASDADCASGCCGFKSGKCAGAIIAQERDGGCGFGNPTPNDDAARKLRGQAPAPPAANNNGNVAAAPPANGSGSGKPPGTQFITGPCANDGECASGCCGFKSGKCAGAIIAQERDGGCGFGNPTPNDDAARKLRGEAPAPPANNNGNVAAAPPAAPAPPANSSGSGKPPGTQFITGPCANDGECASGCCGFKSGKCAGAIIAQERDGGCGFGNATPNDDAARKLRGQSPAPPANNNGNVAAAPPAAPPANGSGSGKPPGTQFITGPCANDGECASGCCGFKSGKCAGAIIAQERDGGCGFGNATPNDDAARKLRGQK